VPNVVELQNCLHSHPTATAALIAWCRERRPDDAEALTVAVLCDCAVDPADYDGPLRLATRETLQYRRVRLGWGDLVISEAENFYVPQRLPEDMRAALHHGAKPFGAVVAELSPQRTTLALLTQDDLAHGGAAAARCRAQLAVGGFAPAEAYALHLTAVMSASGVELAELREHYPRELLEM
jgi:chorismate-pyruvate lyase